MFTYFSKAGKKSSVQQKSRLVQSHSCNAEISKLLHLFWKMQKFGTSTSLCSQFNSLSSVRGFTELQIPLWSDCNEHNDAHNLEIYIALFFVFKNNWFYIV